MSRYSINGHAFNDNDPQLYPLTIKAYNHKVRPLCLCKTPGVEMYIARFEGRYIIKRMPNSGNQHAPTCDSYVPPAELSGLGQVLGHAIQESPEDNSTLLKLEFSLSKGGNRAAPTPGTAEHDSVKSDGNKLTLRGLLHYLWEEAGFNRWYPAMAGKRNWFIVRKYLLQAAEKKMAKGMDLSEILYLPEAFNERIKVDIIKRRTALMTKIAAKTSVRRLMIIVGEIEKIEQARYGHQVVFKEALDWPVMLSDEMHTKLRKRFAYELAVHNKSNNAHLVAIGTISLDAAYTPSFEEISVMITNPNWIPYEHYHEELLLDCLNEGNRRFIKGLRYNLSSKQPLASVILTDTTETATAMYIVPPSSDDNYIKQVDELVKNSELKSWIYHAQDEMPPLPPAANQNYQR